MRFAGIIFTYLKVLKVKLKDDHKGTALRLGQDRLLKIVSIATSL